MSPQDIWQSVYERFDPERAAEDRALRVDRPSSPADKIIRLLDRPRRDPRVLFTGTVGTGKTMELLRVAEARRGKEIVVFLDLERHFVDIVKDPAALQRITPWEACFLAGLRLIEEVLNLLVGFTQLKSRRVLFVIDGLDRIRDIERAKALFVDSQMISGLACPSIVCGPFALRHHPSPITHHPSPITHHPSPITHHPSPITHHPSPITHHPSPIDGRHPRL